ncbi:hypothetical protein AGMMS49525_17830 [Bacteroidia bacterium]|nr:hypothetical protein AGMMS49525_17830 [Bacteroidia bacterium]
MITGNRAQDVVRTLQIEDETIAREVKVPYRITHDTKTAEYTLFRDGAVIDTYSEKFPITAGAASLRVAYETVKTVYLRVGETIALPTKSGVAEALWRAWGINSEIVVLKGYTEMTGKRIGKETILAVSDIFYGHLEEEFEVMVVDPNIKTIDPAAVHTLLPTKIALKGTILNGEISSDAFIERGFCYSTSPNPTITDILIKAEGTQTRGGFSANTGNLTNEQIDLYYYCAYAKTKSGIVIYGAEQSFSIASGYNVTTEEPELTSKGVTLKGSYNDPDGRLKMPRFDFYEQADPKNIHELRNVTLSKSGDKVEYSGTLLWKDLKENTAYNVRTCVSTMTGHGYEGKNEVSFSTHALQLIAYASNYPEIPQTSGSAWTASAKGHIQPVQVTEPIVLYNRKGYNSVNLDAKLFEVGKPDASPVGQGDIVWSSTDPNVEIRSIEGLSNKNITINTEALQGMTCYKG